MKKFLKGTQEKAMAIFLPLTRLWYIMKEERSLIPENDDEAAPKKDETIINTCRQQCKSQRGSEGIKSGNGLHW